MYARKEWRDVTSVRIVLRPGDIDKLAKDHDISITTASKYLTDAERTDITAPKRNDVLVDAVNKYGGFKQVTTTKKEVVIIDEDDEPENHY